MKKQKTFTKETEETLLKLITRELQEEYSYQVDTGENDLWYVKKLLKAEIEIYNIIDKGGIDTYVHNIIIEEDLQKYGNLTIKYLYEE